MTLSPKCSTPSNTSLKESTIASACTRLLATCHRLNLKQRFCYETNLNYLCHFWGALQPFLTCSWFLGALSFSEFHISSQTDSMRRRYLIRVSFSLSPLTDHSRKEIDGP